MKDSNYELKKGEAVVKQLPLYVIMQQLMLQIWEQALFHCMLK